MGVMGRVQKRGDLIDFSLKRIAVVTVFSEREKHKLRGSFSNPDKR